MRLNRIPGRTGGVFGRYAAPSAAIKMSLLMYEQVCRFYKLDLL